SPLPSALIATRQDDSSKQTKISMYFCWTTAFNTYPWRGKWTLFSLIPPGHFKRIGSFRPDDCASRFLHYRELMLCCLLEFSRLLVFRRLCGGFPRCRSTRLRPGLWPYVRLPVHPGPLALVTSPNQPSSFAELEIQMPFLLIWCVGESM